jgi:hypothetical protein
MDHRIRILARRLNRLKDPRRQGHDESRHRANHSRGTPAGRIDKTLDELIRFPWQSDEINTSGCHQRGEDCRCGQPNPVSCPQEALAERDEWLNIATRPIGQKRDVQRSPWTK